MKQTRNLVLVTIRYALLLSAILLFLLYSLYSLVRDSWTFWIGDHHLGMWFLVAVLLYAAWEAFEKWVRRSDGPVQERSVLDYAAETDRRD